MSQWNEFVSKYPQISFNYNPQKANKDHYLLAAEASSTNPSNYDFNEIAKFKGIISWNQRFLDEVRQRLPGFPTYSINGFPLFDNHYHLEPSEFYPFEHKLDGICCVCRYRQKSSDIRDITYLRLEAMEALDLPVRDCFGKVPYGGSLYKGQIGQTVEATYPSSKAKLQTLSRYKFNLSMENEYHPLYGYSYVTEKIMDSWKARVVPLYLGAVNHKEILPQGAYVDLEEFGSLKNGWRSFRYDDLSKYLKSIGKNQYEDMVEKGFEWVNTTRTGNIEDFEKVLQGLP